MADAVWRIARRPYARDRLGIGARESGGRWNGPGTAVIYAGRTIAVAALEQFVHLAGIVPADLVLVRIELPDGYSAETPNLSDLPKDWDRLPPGPSSIDFGTTWVREGRSLAFYVPSVLVPEERNAVLNPNHPEFAQVTMIVERNFRFDPRMFAGATR
ncbi:MAG: RES family NAD+ phosphorylase [Candidatus Binatia bacterium]